MLATLTDRPFSDPAWIYETKLDGQRSLLFREGEAVRLMTRNRKDRTSHYPDLEEAGRRAIDVDLIADGEIVAFDGARTSFSRLQGRMQNARPSAALVTGQPVIYYLFDLLWIDGEDLTSLQLLERKGGFAVRRRPLPRVAQTQMRPGTGVRRRRVDRPPTQPDGDRRAAGRLLRRGRPPFRGEGRDGIQPARARPALREARSDRSYDLAAPRHDRRAEERRPLGTTSTGRTGRVRRVDARRQAAPPAIPRAPRRQVADRGRPRAVVGKGRSRWRRSSLSRACPSTG
jgi:hypothetical protein